jgi:hypothetical protein
MSVDLPAPFWPIKQCTWPLVTVDAAESTDARIILDQAADLQQRSTRFVHAHRPLFDPIPGAAPALVLD